ncbi:MAG: glycosyltransferase [Flavobacteriales bacterium]|jgi:glycosyltransferase involved in cell wall biosynthesis|nr:MAG: glycosyltransferase [Flavobacteriales bacterium]
MWSIEFQVLLGALIVLLAYHALMFTRLAFGKREVEPDRDLPVSVVICARNEARTLEELIPVLMDQDHREFEVVVVNDRSDDDTWEILQWMKPHHPRLRPVNIQADEKFNYGKKIALGVGVRAARHPFVLLTDADCVPPGRDWISVMAAGFRSGRRIVIGHSPYAKSPGLGSILERYDGAVKAMQFMGFAQAGVPYMGVGRNLGYASEVFFGASGPRRHNHLMSGDDDLFINEVARRGNTAVVADPRSFMTTRPTPGLAAWIRRKRRHYTTAVHYRFGHQVLLMLLPLARLVFWAALALLAHQQRWAEAAIGLGAQLLLLLPVTISALRRLQAGAVAWFALPLEWLFLLLDPLLYASTILVKPKRWK